MPEGLVKVQLTAPNGQIETVWARPLGGDRFELDNTPWYPYGLSFRDVIEARRQTADGFPEFVRVVQKSGHRTIRVILSPPADASPASQAVLERLKALGCACEGGKSRFIAVDIPPAVDLMVIRQFLIGTGQKWEHADPTYDELFPEGDR